MPKIVVQAFMTLDGVVQAGGRPDEDLDGGFAHGGWQVGYALDDSVRIWESRTEALLLGRRTYEIFAGSWGVWDEQAEGFQGELTRRYNRIPKYVASRKLTAVSWQHTRLLEPDLAADVRRIRAEPETRPDAELRVWGSTQLIRTLAELDLIDEYRLVVYPLVLGAGKRLFAEGFPVSRLALAESRALPSGVVVQTYRPVVEN